LAAKMNPIFNDYQKKLSDIILENNIVSPLSDLYSKEVKELAVIWSYYSGKIEGNTYSFVFLRIGCGFYCFRV